MGDKVRSGSMPVALTLDAHAHLRTGWAPEALAACGAVLALTLSLDEAERAFGDERACGDERALADERGLARDDGLIAWGVDCYPGNRAAFEAFDVG